MRPVLSRHQMRQFDRHAIDVAKVPSLLLMENAGRGATDIIRSHFTAMTRAIVCAGSGNNGGDGFVVARRLLVLGVRVNVLCSAPGEKMTQDAATMRQAYEELGGQIQPLTAQSVAELAGADEVRGLVVVDALFGTGLDREVQGELSEVIRAINASDAPVASLDIPSGLDADSGTVHGVAVQATVTISFGHLKLGLMTPIGHETAGELHVVDIGVPAALVEKVGHSAEALDLADLRSLLPPRPKASHKVQSGRVAVLAGGPGTVGAAHLVARGSLRAGAGLVTLLNYDAVVRQLEGQVAEVMTARIDEQAPAESLKDRTSTSKVLALGPGLGTGQSTLELVQGSFELPCIKVFDADALTVLAGCAEGLKTCAGAAIITPHPGEAARLLGTTAKVVEADRFDALMRLVALTQATVILKGSHTLIGAPGRLPRVNTTGSAILATGGAGDVLTGIVAALAAQVDAFTAACLGAGIHGRCGDSWRERMAADRGMLASEIADEVPRVLAQLSDTGKLLTD